MTNRIQHNLSSLGFTAIVLLSVLVGGAYKEKTSELIQQQDIEQTSVTAAGNERIAELPRPDLPVQQAGLTSAIKVIATMVPPTRESGQAPKIIPVIPTKTFELTAAPKQGLRQTLNAAVGYAVNLTTSQPLLTVENKKRWAMASLTKLMTAVIASEKLGMTKPISLSAEAMAIEGNNWGLPSAKPSLPAI